MANNTREDEDIPVWEEDEELIKYEGLDDAIIGLTDNHNNKEVLVYDYEKILEVLMKTEKMDLDGGR